MMSWTKNLIFGNKTYSLWKPARIKKTNKYGYVLNKLLRAHARGGLNQDHTKPNAVHKAKSNSHKG